MDIPEEIRDDLESRANVVGTCRGPKRVRGQATGEEVIVVLVSRKLPESHLAETDRIPAEIEIDGQRVRTDVQEVGDVRTQATASRPAAPDRKGRFRPAPAGVSLGHPEITAGTLGSPALETEDGRTVVLTNAHVAAPVGVAETGDDILQPGPADGGREDDALGTLAAFSEISSDEPNTTDSALVEVDPGDVRDTVLGVGPFAGFTDAGTDATYTKSGRTTGVTTGDLRGRDVRIRVNGYHDEPTLFTGVDLFGPMSAGGDSGSLIGVVDGGFRATHLLFAGSDRATIAAPMDAVEAEHGELTPVGGGDDGAGSGGGDDPAGDDGSDGDASLRAAVERRLVDAYGVGTVSPASDVAFRVAGPVPMVVALASTAEAAPAAAGRALAAADAGTVPVLAYPATVEDETVDRLGARLTLLPVATE
ncbi:hypothetical protein [Halomarina oriensis]|uniref:Serine protease n=1 Tax=Halomarina oriensis TaxID=671145 RepID=A0A6B0GEJ4_9EURY|nr:hypothetical protein [Halomarina oriensis]MWG32950.1 hypothetical protein [Halomarina oriensis]